MKIFVLFAAFSSLVALADYQSFQQQYESINAYDLSYKNFVDATNYVTLGLSETSHQLSAFYGGTCFWKTDTQTETNGALLVIQHDFELKALNVTEAGKPADFFTTLSAYDPLSLENDLPFLRATSSVKSKTDIFAVQKDNGSDVDRWNVGVRVRTFQKPHERAFFVSKIVRLVPGSADESIGYCAYPKEVPAISRPNPVAPSTAPIFRPRKNFFIPCFSPGYCQ